MLLIPPRICSYLWSTVTCKTTSITYISGNPYVFVADFNQVTFRKALMNEEYVTGARTMKLMHEAGILDDPSQMFSDPVTTSLPYRWGTVRLPGNYDNVNSGGAMVSEDSNCFVYHYCILSV
ncbi:unnamed protein product [Somion occarium]|uniref:Uncharacterized protein n=1 Tax=Somion occarium TaxID=3059160 RepID=A0ABP1D3T8_9APHY